MRILSRLIPVLVPAALCMAIGCNDSAQAVPHASVGSAPAQATEPPDPSGAEIPSDRYPGIGFALLEQDERARFTSLAEAELCPCEGGVSSLDTCLRSDETTCMLAAQVAALMMRLIKEDSDDTEIADGVQGLVANARAVHSFQLDASPWRGATEPQLTVVEFADFECPHCAALAVMLEEIYPEYADRVRFYFKQFPLQTHVNSLTAAVATLAAHRQGLFWPFHSALFAAQNDLHYADDPTELYGRVADEVGLNRERFLADLADPALLAVVQADRDEGIAAGINATPTLYLNGVQVLDSFDIDGLRALLDARLAAPRP